MNASLGNSALANLPLCHHLHLVALLRLPVHCLQLRLLKGAKNCSLVIEACIWIEIGNGRLLEALHVELVTDRGHLLEWLQSLVLL